MSGEQWKLLCDKKSSRMTTFRAFVQPPPPNPINRLIRLDFCDDLLEKSNIL